MLQFIPIVKLRKWADGNKVTFSKVTKRETGEASAETKHSYSVAHGGWGVRMGWRLAGGSTVTFSITRLYIVSLAAEHVSTFILLKGS